MCFLGAECHMGAEIAELERLDLLVFEAVCGWQPVETVF